MEKIDNLGKNINIPWIVIGNYNKVLTSQDRIGGNHVTINKYKELDDKMQRNGLFQAPTKGCHYTWSKKHTTGAIHSRIDKLIGNLQWFHTYQDATVEIFQPNISDHSPIIVSYLNNQTKRKFMFKFLSCVTMKDGYQ